MIAPLRQDDGPAVSDNPTMRKARRLVAEALFAEQEETPAGAPPVPAWQAWAFVLWIVGVMGVYLASMAGLL